MAINGAAHGVLPARMKLLSKLMMCDYKLDGHLATNFWSNENKIWKHPFRNVFCILLDILFKPEDVITNMLYDMFLKITMKGKIVLWVVTTTQLEIIGDINHFCGFIITSFIWGLWCQRQISWAGISSYIPQFIVGCNYLSLPEIPASVPQCLCLVYVF